MAYLKYIVYNADSVYVTSGIRMVTALAKNLNWEELQLNYKVEQDGFVQVFVSNDSNVDAFFDDIAIRKTPSLVVQENHYDPWGQDLVGINKIGKPDHKFTYNGKEKQEEFGLNWQDYGARFYDSQLGKWHSVDNSAEEYFNLSPYNYVNNNPVRNTDPDGNDGWDTVKGILVATADNVTGGAVNFRDKVSFDNAGDFNAGQNVADQAAMAVGAALMVDGAADVGAGVVIAGSSVALAGPTGSASSPGVVAGLGIAGMGAAKAGVGYALFSQGSNNLNSQKGRASEPIRTKHTDNRHINRTKYPEKSKYSKPNQVRKLENRTMKNPDKKTIQSNGRIAYEKDFGRKIGTKGQTSQKVVHDPKKNKIITSYPQN